MRKKYATTQRTFPEVFNWVRAQQIIVYSLRHSLLFLLYNPGYLKQCHGILCAFAGSRRPSPLLTSFPQ